MITPIVTAVLGVIFWQSTMALIAVTISYCMFYVVIYRKIMRRKVMLAGAQTEVTIS